MLSPPPGLAGNPRFRIDRHLGSGGMGSVFAAWDREREETIAVKTLRFFDAGALYALKREFRTLADVVHPNLVALYELFADQDLAYFTMELVEGSHFLAWAASVDEQKLREVLRQVTSALLALHETDKVHCDLKPTNLLVTPQGRAVILDFGLAQDLGPRISARSVHDGIGGSLPFIAPEILLGRTAGPKSDFYALGVVLFEILTGTSPFSGNPLEIIDSKRIGPVPDPWAAASDLPKDLAELCTDLLAPQPELRPGGFEILARLASASPQDETRPGEAQIESRRVDAYETVGRDRELDLLLRELKESRRRAFAVWIHGEAGVGKTTLARSFLRTCAEEHDAVVLDGRCYEREMVPYKALDGVLDCLARYLRTLTNEQVQTLLPRDVRSLARLFPVLLRVEELARTAPEREPEDLLFRRQRGIVALRELFARIAAKKTLVIYIEDLHWADADSIVLLEEIMRPPDSPALLLLACFRREELAEQEFLRSLLHETERTDRRELALEPLPAEAVAELARSLLTIGEQADENLIQRILWDSQGNPFLVDQLLATVSTAKISDGLGLGEMLSARLAQFPPEAESLLLAVAAAGRPIETAIAFEAAAIDGDERPLVHRLCHARLLRSHSSGRIEIFHDRLRHLLAERTDAAAARDLHRRLAEILLTRRGEDPAAIYRHFQLAGEARRAGEYAALAARRAEEAAAFDRAALFYRYALELGEPTGRQVYRRLFGLASALDHSGRPRAAVDAYLTAAQEAPPLERLQCRRLAARSAIAGGDFERGLDLVRAVGREVGLDVETNRFRARTSLLWHRLRNRMTGLSFVRRDIDETPAEELLRIDICRSMASSLLSVDPLLAAELQARHLSYALDAGEPVRVSRALAAEGAFRALLGGRRKAAELIERARGLAEETGDPEALGVAVLQSGLTSLLSGAFRRAARQCEEAKKIFREQCSGAVWETATARRGLLMSWLRLGEIEDLERHVPLWLARAQERGDLQAATMLRTRCNLLWLFQDDLDRARDALQQARSDAERASLSAVLHYETLLGACRIDLYAGDADAAQRRFSAAWNELRRSPLLRVAWYRAEVFFLRGRIALAVGDVRGVGETRAALRKEDAPDARVFSAVLDAGDAERSGDRILAVERLRTAHGDATRLEMELYATAAGQILQRLGDGKPRRRSAAIDPRRFEALLIPGFTTSVA